MPRHRDTTRTVGFVVVAAGVAIFSTDALLIRLQGMPVPQILFWRGVLSALGFGAVTCIASRGHIVRAVLTLGWVGLAIALLRGAANIAFVLSVEETSVAQAFVILATTPLMTALLSKLLVADHLPRRTWLTALAAAAGVTVIFAGSFGTPQLAGDLWAIAGGLSISLTLVIVRSSKNLDRFAAMAAGCALGVIPVLPFLGAGIGISAPNALVAFLNGAVVLPAAVALVTLGPKYLPAPEVSLFLLLETVMAPLWVWLVLGQQPEARTVIAGAVVLAALAFHSAAELSDERRRMRATAAGGSQELAPEAAAPGL